MSWQKACGHWYLEIYRYKIWIKVSHRVHNNYSYVLGCLQAVNPISLRLACGWALLSQYISSCKYGYFIWISQWSGLCKYQIISFILSGLKGKAIMAARNCWCLVASALRLNIAAIFYTCTRTRGFRTAESPLVNILCQFHPSP